MEMMIRYFKGSVKLVMKNRLYFLAQSAATKVGKKLLRKNLNIKDGKILLLSPEKYCQENILKKSFQEIGFAEQNIFYNDSSVELGEADYIYVADGNTFEIISFLRENLWTERIRMEVLKRDVSYIGVSAGAVIAGKDICIAYDFDKNEVGITENEGLALFDGFIIPHYSKSDLKRYISNCDTAFVSHYRKKLSVADGKILIIGRGDQNENLFNG